MQCSNGRILTVISRRTCNSGEGTGSEIGAVFFFLRHEQAEHSNIWIRAIRDGQKAAFPGSQSAQIGLRAASEAHGV